MKIFFIGANLQNDNMEFHVMSALNSMGHAVEFFGNKQFLGLQGKNGKLLHSVISKMVREPELINDKKIISRVDAYSPDLIVVLLGNFISPKTIKSIRAISNAPIVCWCQDQLSTLGRQFVLSGCYDMVFMKDMYMVNLFNHMVSDTYRYLPEACNPDVHYLEPVPSELSSEYECDVTTAASLYYYRQSILKYLDEYNLKVWGAYPDWLDYGLGNKHTKKFVSSQTKRWAFSSAKIVLNTLHFAEIEAVNCRLFEVAGCGGFQLVSHKECIAKYFEPDFEVVTFVSSQDLRNKVKYYLNEPELRKSISMNAMMRAHAEHNYQARIESMFKLIG